MIAPPPPPTELPVAPAHEAEWEDWLLRFELGPRLVRAAAEDLAPAAWRRPLASGLRPLDHLAHLVAWERHFGAWLEAAAAGRPAPEPPPPLPGEAALAPAPPPLEAEPVALLDEFAALRAAHFGRVAPRGPEIWTWRAPWPDGRAPTLPQLLAWLLRHEAWHAAQLRRAATAGC